MQNLSSYQRQILVKNPNVEKITDKNVFYTAQFKIRSVERYIKGTNPNKIFKDSGINPDCFFLSIANHVCTDGKINLMKKEKNL